MSTIESICNQSTFTRIFKEYASTLHNFLYYKTGNAELAEDYTQEAFSKLWKNCDSVKLAGAKGYVFKSANNLMLNDFKRKKVIVKHQNQLNNRVETENPEHILEQKEFQSRLNQSIAELPEKQRVVFLLSRIDKKTYQEIAELLGISKKAVEKRMYLALDSLRKLSKYIP